MRERRVEVLQERGELALAAKLASDLGLSSRKEISAEAAEAAAAEENEDEAGVREPEERSQQRSNVST